MSSPDKPVLKVAPCDHAAAKYAVENWHYSQVLPAGKLFKIGVWEGDKFVGCVIFGYGATPQLLKPYGLVQTEGCELVRIAMRKHDTPVSRVLGLALRILKRENPGTRLVVSFADPSQGHHGGIYQATNWIYTGSSARGRFYTIHGKITHPRSLVSAGKENSLSGAREIDPHASPIMIEGKHRYLFPLDQAMKRKVEPLSKPYPKRAGSSLGEHSVTNGKEGGSTPTPALHLST